MLRLDHDQIETERLVLRSPGDDDVARIVELANNCAIAEKLARMPFPYGEADARAWLHSLAGLPAGSATFAIGCKGEAGAFIGACGYDPLLTGMPDLGYWLGEHYWGRGYASEAAAAVLAHAFKVSGLDSMTSGCRTDNPASRRVLEKLGFKAAGHKTMFSLGAGREVEIEAFALTREQWLAARLNRP